MKYLLTKNSQPVHIDMPGDLILDVNGAPAAMTLGRSETVQLAGVTLTEREVEANELDWYTPGLTIVSDDDGRIIQRNELD